MPKFENLAIKIKKKLMYLIFAWKAICNLNALFAKRSRDGLLRYDVIFLLFYELCDDTVENFVIGDSSSDDGVLARWDINVEKSV